MYFVKYSSIHLQIYIRNLELLKIRDGKQGFDSRQGQGFFLFSITSRPAPGPIQPPIQRVPRSLFAGLKLSGRETDHSPPSGAEVKNTWGYTSTTKYIFMAWCLVKCRGKGRKIFGKITTGINGAVRQVCYCHPRFRIFISSKSLKWRCI
jgi:hypothetical protein